jgi:hypothetical protein
VNNVTAVLHGTNISNGTPLPESPLSPATDFTCVNVDGSPPDRTQLGETVLFKLPDGWDSGGVNLEVEINPGGPIPDTNTSNNTLAEAIPYRSLPHACIRTYRVRTEGSFRPPDGGIIIDPLPPKYYLTRDPDNLLDRALSLLPLPEIVIYAESNILEEWEFVQWGPYDLNDDDDDSWKILHTLWWHDQLSDDPDECDGADARTHYMGMVHQGTTGNFAGIALIDQLVVKVSNESLPGRDFNNPWGGRTLAHELGHNYWRGHVDCGDIPWYQPDDDDYPYGCDIGPDDPEAFYGLDLFSVDTDISALEVIEPTAAGDLMSYAPKRWVSDYTWRKIWLDLCLQQSNLCIYTGNPENPVIFQTTVPESPQKTLVPDDLLIISGLLTTDTLQIESAYRFTQTLVTNGKFEKLLSEQNNLQADAGDFVVQLLDSGGNILHSQPFTPSHASDSTSILSMFGLAVPFNPATAEIKVASILTPTIVSTRTVSANAPTVEIISPNGGETITDTMTISWVGSDVDNDPLVYTVQYSADLGQTWRVLAANIYTTTFTVDSSLLPGSQEMGLVQVIPSDGVNTGSDRSDEPFTVPPRSPLASIQDPDNGAVFTPGDFVTLRGVGYDPEDGQITGSSLSWSIEGLGIVGTGQQISLFDLDPGTYEATLTATDSDEMSTSDTITFRVGTPNLIFLPMILR